MPKFRIRRVPVTDGAGRVPGSPVAIPAPSTATVRPVTARQTPGHVRHDDRGNAIWEFGDSSTSADRDPGRTTQPLRILEIPGLSLADDAPTPVQTARANPHGVVKGYDPYDSGRLDRKKKDAPVKKDLRKLSEWIALRNQAAKNDPLKD